MIIGRIIALGWGSGAKPERTGITVDGVHNQLEGQPPPAQGGSWWPPR